MPLFTSAFAPVASLARRWPLGVPDVAVQLALTLVSLPYDHVLACIEHLTEPAWSGQRVSHSAHMRYMLLGLSEKLTSSAKA
jgi:hypothetical protein